MYIMSALSGSAYCYSYFLSPYSEWLRGWCRPIIFTVLRAPKSVYSWNLLSWISSIDRFRSVGTCACVKIGVIFRPVMTLEKWAYGPERSKKGIQLLLLLLLAAYVKMFHTCMRRSPRICSSSSRMHGYGVHISLFLVLIFAHKVNVPLGLVFLWGAVFFNTA